MHYLVYGVDVPSAGERLDALAERHWDYMDEYGDRLVARGPTLSPDGEEHTGSIHVIEAADTDEVWRFAYDEPYWRAGLYASVTVSRLRSALDGSMWDRPQPNDDQVSTLILMDWPTEPITTDTEQERVLATLAAQPPLVFGGLLLGAAGTNAVGLVAALDLDPSKAGRVAASFHGPQADAASTTLHRWQRGGRPGNTR